MPRPLPPTRLRDAAPRRGSKRVKLLCVLLLSLMRGQEASGACACEPCECCECREERRTLSRRNLPSGGESILLGAQAMYFGLAAAVNRQSRTWKHPTGRGRVYKIQVAILIGSALHFLFIVVSFFLLRRTRFRTEHEWMLALHLVLPSPLFVPTVCLMTYRYLGTKNVGARREAMRKKNSNWDDMQGTHIPYVTICRTWKHVCINVTALLLSLGCLGWLGFGMRLQDPIESDVSPHGCDSPDGSPTSGPDVNEDTGGGLRDWGISFPFFSALAVLLLSGVLDAIPGLPDSKRPRHEIRGDEVNEDQLIIPVLDITDDTSVIVISWSDDRTNDDLNMERLSTNLEFTPFKRSKYPKALKKLIRMPPDADHTEEFIEDFQKAFEHLTLMLNSAARSHHLSERFIRALDARKRLILGDVQVFDGHSTKMRALAMAMINKSLNYNRRMHQELHLRLREVRYKPLKSVSHLVNWAYGAAAKSYAVEFSGADSRDADIGGQADLEDVEVANIIVKDCLGTPYHSGKVNAMIQRLTHQSGPFGRSHEVILFLLLQRMAQNNDYRLLQRDTLGNGRDVKICIRMDQVEVVPMEDHDPASRSEFLLHTLNSQGRASWTARRSLVTYPDLQEFQDTYGNVSMTDIVSGANVPVAWNAFWVIQQHVMSWMLTYIASCILFIAIDFVFIRALYGA